MKHGSNLGSNLIVSEVTSFKFNDERTIDYASGNRLEYHEHPGKTGYVFNYHCGERAIRLNDLLYDGEKWDFYPADGFVVVIAEGGNILDRPEIRLDVTGRLTKGGYNPSLIDEEMAILAALHEIGHANLYILLRDMLHPYSTGLKELLTDSLIKRRAFKASNLLSGQFLTATYSDSETYAHQLAATHKFFNRLFGEAEFERSGERHAWAFAFKTIMNHRILEQFDIHDFRHYYVPLLRGHGQGFVNAKGNNYNHIPDLSRDDYFWRKRAEPRSWRKRNIMAPEDKTKNI